MTNHILPLRASQSGWSGDANREVGGTDRQGADTCQVRLDTDLVLDVEIRGLA
jgi:hypothetical protein